MNIKSPTEIDSRVREIFRTQYVNPLASSRFLGGLAAIFFFESALVLARILTTQEILLHPIAAVVAAIFSYGVFLVFEAIGGRAIAFTARWTVPFYFIAFLMLLFYFVSAVPLIVTKDPELYNLFLLGVRLGSSLLVTCAFIRGLGIIFDKSALRKNTYLASWVVLGLTMLLLSSRLFY